MSSERGTPHIGSHVLRPITGLRNGVRNAQIEVRQKIINQLPLRVLRRSCLYTGSTKGDRNRAEFRYCDTGAYALRYQHGNDSNDDTFIEASESDQDMKA